ncbi:hypothetical protein GCM10010344_00510 [Streptomyces bluensis]|nr:hypothetical protein GCM10010344_00510 [Streptomyces bluensis]
MGVLLSDGSDVASLAGARWRAVEAGGVEGSDCVAGRLVVHADAAKTRASAGAMRATARSTVCLLGTVEWAVTAGTADAASSREPARRGENESRMRGVLAVHP